MGKPYRDGGPAVNEWEIPGLKTAVHVEGTLNDPSDTDRFWSVEFAIPWKVLAEYAHRPAPPRDGDQWRINFSRVEWRHEVKDGKYRKVPGTREDNWVWSPQGVIDMHRPESGAIVQFSTAAPGSVSFHPDPAGPVRDRLIEVYHAQKRFHEKHKRWAERSSELDLPAWPTGSPEPAITNQANTRRIPGGHHFHARSRHQTNLDQFARTRGSRTPRELLISCRSAEGPAQRFQSRSGNEMPVRRPAAMLLPG